MSRERVSYGRRLGQLAAEHPNKAAILFIPESGNERLITWQEFDRAATSFAHLLQPYGVMQGSLVVIGLENCPEHFVAAYAAWRLGATVLPMNHRAPPPERDSMLELAQPAIVVADWSEVAFPTLSRSDLHRADSCPQSPLPDRISNPGRAIGSGGSTGQPKIIVNGGAWTFSEDDVQSGLLAALGIRKGQTQLVAGPLYHNAPFGWGHMGLAAGHTLVLFERFDAARVVDAIERHRIHMGYLAPVMMQRIAQLPDIARANLSSIEFIFHTSAPCPEWVKRAWFDLIGPEKVMEGYGSTEDAARFLIRGDEWLAHPGSVGSAELSDVCILDEGGNELPAGAVGEIFARPRDSTEPTYAYIGSSPAKSTSVGLVSVGDMGWMDEDGYLYIADRRVDLILSGGSNVYPAEVEAVLSSHPQVVDVVVIGLPDAEWGKRIHAIVQPRDAANPPSREELSRYARERLAPYKIPKSWDLVEEFPRDAAGKLRRGKLVADRI